MKKRMIITITALSFSMLWMFPAKSYSQDNIGMSFSYFFPKNGYFTNPVSPIAIRGVGMKITDFMSLSTGMTLFRVGGMSIKDVPFPTDEPILGPLLSFTMPLELIFKVRMGDVGFEVNGGAFGFYNFNKRINYGNLDRALAEYYGADVVNATWFDYDKYMGWGWQFGGEVIIYVTESIGITLRGNYYIGDSDINLEGQHESWSEGSGYSKQYVEFPDSKLDFRGLEISLGGIYKN